MRVLYAVLHVAVRQAPKDVTPNSPIRNALILRQRHDGGFCMPFSLMAELIISMLGAFDHDIWYQFTPSSFKSHKEVVSLHETIR